MRVAVIVLGDLGRSPRMQRHALMLANEGYDVHLIGYAGHDLFPELEVHPRITVSTIPEYRRLRRYALLAPLRQLTLAFSLLSRLITTPRCRAFFVQNPPALPTLIVTGLVAVVWRSSILIDWHNLTSALARLRYPYATGLIARIEKVMAREGYAHFAVSDKMARYLETTMGIARVHSLHDLPMRHLPNPEKVRPDRDERITIMTGTSFTEDEELPMIEEAAVALDHLATAGRIPPITFIVAGDGDRREELERKWHALPLRHVRFEFGWFRQDEYQRRLRQSTIGLSLHRSTSNLDLPMKVSDMIGAGLPMLVLDYDPVLREMIDERSTMFFRTGPELVTAITTLLENLPDNDRLVNMRRAAAAAETDTWEAAWSRIVSPIFLELAKE